MSKSKFYRDLSPSAQTAYAQTLDHAMVATVHRSVADLTGSFARKTVSGKEYWYFQYRDIDSKVKQVYLGPRGERLDKLIAEKESASGKEPSKQEKIAMQARAAIALGNFDIPKSQFKVLRRLDEYGFFRAGGVLIGTHAFACYGNMFGVSWGNYNATQDLDLAYAGSNYNVTQDLDFAYAGRNLSVALPSDVKLDVHDAITSLEMGFLPSSKLDGLVGGTYVIPRDPDFRLDFITTTGRESGDLVNFPNLNVAMVPLKFMEYSLQGIEQAAILSADGAILANLPNPARYALHKLIVAGERAGSFRTKVRKDLWQSAALITYLLQHQPENLADAWIDLQGRGKGWRSRFQSGVNQLLREMPAMGPALKQCTQIVLERQEALADDADDESESTPSP